MLSEQDFTKIILEKIDNLSKDLQAIHESIAQNEAEHRNIERILADLMSKKNEALQGLAWASMIMGLILTAVNLLIRR